MYKDYFILLTQLLKVRENIKRNQPKKERRVKEIKEKRVKEREIPLTKLSIQEKDTKILETIEDYQQDKPIDPEQKPGTKMYYLDNENEFESVNSSKRTSINDQGLPLIRVEIGEKSYINPTNTYVQLQSVMTSNSRSDKSRSENDEAERLNEETDATNELNKVMDEFYSLQ